MIKRRICKVCVANWKKRLSQKERKAMRKAMREQKRKMRSFYPERVFHVSGHRLCKYHHALARADGAKRRAAKLKATPRWADRKEIAKVYAEAVERTRETGVRMEVDHIVPLRGENVCGLHVANNLQVLTRTENSKKGNRFSGDVGEQPAGASPSTPLPE